MTTIMLPKRTYRPNPRTLRAVKNFFKKYPGASTNLCAKELRMDFNTVKRYRAMLGV